MNRYLKWTLITIGGFIALNFVVAIVYMTMHPEKLEQVEAEQKAEDVKQAQQAKIDEAKEAAQAKADLIKQAQKQKAPLIAYHKTMMAAMRNCEASSGAAIDQFVELVQGKRDRFTTYDQARKGMEFCADAKLETANISKPEDMSDPVAKSIDDGSLACFAAVSARHKSMKTLMEMLDSGQIKPSFMADMKEIGDNTQAQTMRCAAGLASAGVQSSIKIEELQ